MEKTTPCFVDLSNFVEKMHEAKGRAHTWIMEVCSVAQRPQPKAKVTKKLQKPFSCIVYAYPLPKTPLPGPVSVTPHTINKVNLKKALVRARLSSFSESQLLLGRTLGYSVGLGVLSLLCALAASPLVGETCQGPSMELPIKMCTGAAITSFKCRCF